MDLSPLLSFLIDKLPYLLLIIIGIIIYELLKVGCKKAAKYITRNKPKAGAALGLAAGLGLLIWFLLGVM